jgi:hypothetical protein
MLKINVALKKLPYKDVEKWYKTTGLKRLGFDLGVTSSGIGYLFYHEKKRQTELLLNKVKNSKKVQNMTDDEYNAEFNKEFYDEK